MTGTTYRWQARASQWKDAWRNLHSPAAPKIEVSLAEESVGTTKVTVEWNGDELESRETYLQRPGQHRETGIESLGWERPLETFRPLMSYDELGGLLTAVVLNMLVVPALYLRYGSAVRRFVPRPALDLPREEEGPLS